MTPKQIILKIQQALSATTQKYVTAEMLSQSIGIYPDVINGVLSMFNPVVTLDVTYNLLDLLPELNQYLGNAKSVTVKRNRPENKSLPYTSFAEFVYQKMTIAGIVDKNIQLADKELKLAKKLIQNELKSRKK
jgi:hypothetical protein